MITKDVLQDFIIIHCKNPRLFSTHGWSKRVNPWIINYAMLRCFNQKCCIVSSHGWVKYKPFTSELNPMAGFFLFWPNPTFFIFSVWHFRGMHDNWENKPLTPAASLNFPSGSDNLRNEWMTIKSFAVEYFHPHTHVKRMSSIWLAERKTAGSSGCQGC